MAVFDHADDFGVEPVLTEAGVQSDGVTPAQKTPHEGFVHDHHLGRGGGVGAADLAPGEHRDASLAEEIGTHRVELGIDIPVTGRHTLKPDVGAPATAADEGDFGAHSAVHAGNRGQGDS